MNNRIKIFLVIVSTAFILASIIKCDLKRFDERAKNWTPVTISSSFDILVTDVYLNHGDFVFNDTFYMNAGSFADEYPELGEIWMHETPFYASKKTGSDTIYLNFENSAPGYLVFRKDFDLD